MAKQNLAYLVAALIAVTFLAGVEAAIPTSMSVDYGSTTTDLTLGNGESGVMSILIKNTGGQNAENVKVGVYGTGSISLSKEFYLGTMVAGESKTVSAIVKIIDQPTPGISAVRVTIYYDGYNSNGMKEDSSTLWEVPVKITGNSLFRVTLPQSTYYEGALNNLTFECAPIRSVSDVEATLTSDCLTVIGSAKQYVADIAAEETAKISYTIRPKTTGACDTELALSYNGNAGTKILENIPIGLNIEASPVDFKVIKVKYGDIGPGDTAIVNITLKNDGSMAAEGTTVRLSLQDPFTPVDGVEKYIGEVAASETVDVSLGVYVNWDATTETYAMPLNIDYKVGGVSNTQEKEVGIDVSGKVMLEVISIGSSGGSVTVTVANIGTRAAESVKATLSSQGGFGGQTQNRTFDRQDLSPAQNQSFGGQQAVDYKSDIKSTKEATFTFSGSFSGTTKLTLEYTGPNNERVTQTEDISISSGMSSATSSANGFRARNGDSGSPFNTLIYVVAAVILIYIWYRYHKKRKRISAGDASDDEEKSLKNLWGRI